MIKKISELTEQDKEKFFKNVKKSVALEQGIPWERMKGCTANRYKNVKKFALHNDYVEIGDD